VWDGNNSDEKYVVTIQIGFSAGDRNEFGVENNTRTVEETHA